MRRELVEANIAKAEVWELIQTLVYGQVSASRILELFYWSQEPGALEIVRGFLSLSTDKRALLLAFFKMADPKSVSISVDRAGKVILSSTEIDDASHIVNEAKRNKLAMNRPHETN